MTANNKRLGIEDLVAVHCTDYFPESGLIKTLGNHPVEVSGDGVSRAKVQIPRETLHFSLNGAHTTITSTNGSGDWANKKYSVIVPLQDLVDRLAVLDSADSYSVGNYPLKDNSEVIVDREKLSRDELDYLTKLAGTEIKAYTNAVDVDDVESDFLPEPIPSYDVNLNGSKVRITVKPAAIPLADFVKVRLAQKGYTPMKVGSNGWRNENSVINTNALYELAKENNLTEGESNRLAGISPHERSSWSLLETNAGLLACELEKPAANDGNGEAKLEEYKQHVARYFQRLNDSVRPANIHEIEAMQRITSTVSAILQRYEEYKQGLETMEAKNDN